METEKSKLAIYNLYLWEIENVKILHPSSFDDAWEKQDNRINRLRERLEQEEARHGALLDLDSHGRWQMVWRSLPLAREEDTDY